MLTPVGEAYLDSIPVLVIAGGIRTTSERKGGLHDIDQLSMFARVSKEAARLTDAETLDRHVEGAINATTAGRPRPVFLEHAIISNRHSGVSSQNAHPQHRQVFAAILENVRKAAAAAAAPKRVLVCRGLANSRNLVNRAEMIEALKPLGFVAVQPERLSFDEQALMFAEAEAIVCEFGAAMANVMFCAPGTKVVEIIAEGQHDPWSAHLAAMLGLEHVALFQRQSEEALAGAPRHAKDSAFAYSVDLPKLIETAAALLG